MTKTRMLILAALFVAAVVAVRLLPVEAQGGKGGPKSAPAWIWLGDAKSNQTLYFRKDFPIAGRVVSAKIYGTCDNQMTIYVNGKETLTSADWETPVFRDVTDQLIGAGKGESPAQNVIAVKAHNSDGAAGLLLRLVIEGPKNKSNAIVTDNTWRVSDREVTGWQNTSFDDRSWQTATVVGKLGDAPWNKINEVALQGGAKFKKPTATPIELIKVKKDFKVELLYSVPRQTQGSWVNMCVDPKGRLITSDQGGKLYRVTPPALGGKADDTKVEELPVDIGEAHGLCWAFDSLYVVVNEGRKIKPRGLWRVTSSQNSDVLDKKELLRELDGSGEHGPHAVLPGPDGKSLYVLCGNHTRLPQIRDHIVPRLWGEDFIVPRQWDASGHAVNIFAPGGYICKTDKDGKSWDLFSIGYRNQFDAAFNRDGELFTFDSDMEWDMNLPWYKPTRVCHVVPGSEFGWRSGTSNFPHYYPDALPPTYDIGPGSPTGVGFGYGAKFPAKYQDAFYVCDWSFGKLYAVHLTPHGASYKAEAEEFMNGSPLPLTDLVVNPKDGALYFAIGGRNTMSGLYRITYVGKESTAPPPHANTEPPLQGARKQLEAFYGRKDPKAIETAWSFLSHEDRFLRYAARTVLEFQDARDWQERALKEKNPIAQIHALIGLARAGEKTQQTAILAALNKIEWAKLTDAQRIDLLRAYQLAFIRGGDAYAGIKKSVGDRLIAVYPSKDRDVNAELCKLISYLEVPGGLSKSMALLAKAPSQEDQIEFAFSLRTIKSGWTMKEREDYFNFFHKAANYRGGNSFHGFLRNIRKEAIDWTLTAQERDDLKDLLAVAPSPKAPKFTFKPRPFVKKYTADELAPVVERGMANRDFDKGRNLFGETKCFVCHRFNNEGGGMGPDLTQVVGRFGARDLLESIVEPSKVISDQYAAIVISTTDGRQVVGRVVNLHGDNMNINTDMLDSNKLVPVNRNLVESIAASKISMMPEGLIDTLNQEEILDLVAYLYSRGDRTHKMFRRD